MAAYKMGDRKMKQKVIEVNDYLATVVKHTKKGQNITIVRDNNENLILKLKYNDKNKQK
jgi:hypothetical protein